jgi:hypothetical protein
VPAQHPTKLDLAINLKRSALSYPRLLLDLRDEVIK